MAEIEGVAFLKMFFDLGPDLHLGGVTDEHADDRATFGSLFQIEQGFAGNPAVLYGTLPVFFEFRSLAHNDIEAIVAQVKRLGRSLDAITKDGDGFVFENPPRFAERKLFSCDNFLFDSAKVNLCHNYLSVGFERI